MLGKRFEHNLATEEDCVIHYGSVDAGGGCVDSSIGSCSLCLGAVYDMSVCWLSAASSITGWLGSNVRKGGDPWCAKWLHSFTLEDSAVPLF